MKIKFFKRCAAAVLAVSVLSMEIIAGAAESGSVTYGNNPAGIAQQTCADAGQTLSGASETVPVPYDLYLSALLDVWYRNDSRAFVALGMGTEEEAAMIYNAVLDSEFLSMDLDAFLGTECPEAIENEFRVLMTQLMGGTRYAVAGCEPQDDGTYTITVVYEQMVIFEPLMNLYLAIVLDMAETWSSSDYNSFPTDEEMMIQLLAALCSSMRVCLENVTYAPPALTTLSVNPQGGNYLPDIEDIAKLEMILFDINTLYD
ncbi:MAG: hypothetical protein NC337_09855 [Roseburia sp.]|nr:hypothetical protein [Roseburia sp.]